MLNYAKNEHWKLLSKYVDPDRGAMAGVKIAGDELIACDGQRLIVLKGAPHAAAQYEGQVLAVSPKGLGLPLPLAEQNYPNYTQVIPKEAAARYTFSLRRDLLPKSVTNGAGAPAQVSFLTSGVLALGVPPGALVTLDLRYLLDLPEDCYVYVGRTDEAVLFVALDLGWRAVIMSVGGEYNHAEKRDYAPLSAVMTPSAAPGNVLATNWQADYRAQPAVAV